MKRKEKARKIELSGGSSLVVAQNGVFLRRAFPKAVEVRELLPYGVNSAKKFHEKSRWRGGALSKKQCGAVVGFLSWVNETHRAEGLVDLVLKDGAVDVQVPMQTGDGTTVTPSEHTERIGTIHSHLGGAFFSGTDDADDFSGVPGVHVVIGLGTPRTSCARVVFGTDATAVKMERIFPYPDTAGRFPAKWKKKFEPISVPEVFPIQEAVYVPWFQDIDKDEGGASSCLPAHYQARREIRREALSMGTRAAKPYNTWLQIKMVTELKRILGWLLHCKTEEAVFTIVDEAMDELATKRLRFFS